MKDYRTNMKVRLLLTFLAVFLTGLTRTGADESKWISIGRLHDWYSSAGCEIETGRRHQTSDQQDGLRFNAQFRDQDVKAAKGLWIGVKNYTDPLANNKVFNYKVVHCGPRVLDDQSEYMPQSFRLYGRFDKPTVVVDGIVSSKIQYMDAVDEVVDNMEADRMLETIVNTSVGITMTRKTYAYSNPGYDNIFIHEYTFKNTGIINKSGTVNQQDLEGVFFYWQFRMAMTKEACTYGENGWMPQNATWGANTVLKVLGQDPAANDPFRCFYAWSGKHSKTNFNSIGAPYATGDGHLGAPQYMGVVTLHADKSVSDPSNDPYQPATTNFIRSDDPLCSDNDQFNDAKMALEYGRMSFGHPETQLADMVGDGFADIDNGGFSQELGYGPYDIPFGDSIKIVVAEGVNGLARDMCYEIGSKWLNNEAPFRLPDGNTTSNADEYKNSWVYTGVDSLMQSFERISQIFSGEKAITIPPPPPTYFEVKSGGDRIILTWSSESESHANFKGYRVYRAVHIPDTTYELVFECGAGTDNPTIVNTYDDIKAQRGLNYYYYVTAFDDGSSNVFEPGVPMESSKFYTMTQEPAYLRRPAGNSLEAIRIVPNPYNIKAKNLQYGESGPDRIMFYNLPPVCTIKIYTVRGDLIKTIEHTDTSGDESWNSITESRQIVVSGVYVVYFETPNGESITKKLVVIR